jgi:hypothetical protein
MRVTKSRRMGEMGTACSTHGGGCVILVGKPGENRPPGRPSCRLLNNIKVDLRENGVVWTGLNYLEIRTSGGLL